MALRFGNLSMVMIVSAVMVLYVSAEIHRPHKPLVPALIVFGDSTVDPGNNNHISTLIKSNFPPYGKDFIGHKPTGRFCNGKLPTDFIAEGLGIKETVPAYLDSTLKKQDLLTGVSFASAGTGYDNRTANTVSAIPMWKEVEYFKEYKAKLEKIAGVEKARRTIDGAIYIVSVGSNDFLENYYINPFRRLQYDVSQFQDYLLQISADIIEEIHKFGAKRIAIAGLPPLGCLPLERTLRVIRRGNGCVEELNQHAIGYNIKLQRMIASLKHKLPGLKIVYADIFSQLIDMEKNPAKYGIQSTRRACCGTGFAEFGYACNNRTPLTCSDASKYIFWDSFHPTEKVYEVVAQDLLDGGILKLLNHEMK